jgi:NADH:ubiquinone oxidoreductase subunit F (NADH-binding)/(2Fe-2S) ferredoxin/Pyruvate/2-oxoacid:ferredoxin oxidoreductase delta subunit
MVRINSAAALEKAERDIVAGRDPNKPCITLCSGSGCVAYASEKVSLAFEDEINKSGLATKVDLKRTGCHGFCEKGPLVVIYPEEICYVQVQPEHVPDIVAETVVNKQVIEKLLCADPFTAEKIIRESEIPFYKNQTRLVFGSNSHIDPANIEDYLALGGYASLAKALHGMTPQQVVDEIKKSKLRGRGGGGFPAGRKWELCRNAPGDTKYVIVNADEGDPGAYMDRSLLEGNPHSVIEGLLIGAYAMGSHQGYIYVRQEYPLAVANVGIALEQAEEHGFLGENILGSGFDFNITIHRGAGAFVCGEETALIASIEGRRGMPRPRPPYPAISGLWGKPTNINNVETWANVPMIIDKGADWYTSIGTEGSKGTKIFSLVGKVNNTGLVEVPMGITLRDIIYKIGGGIPEGKAFKAVQTGGPSGGCIPEEMIDLPVDFDELIKAGSMMGSGGMVIMDEDTCMVDTARFLVAFMQDESCGECVPCRLGTKRMLEILTRITQGEGREEDIELLQELSGGVKDASLCGLGQTAPNPVLSTLRYFRDEYDAHIKEKRCPALVCKALTSHYIEPSKCMACLLCLRGCPTGAIVGAKNTIHYIDQDKCNGCGTCFDVCPDRFDAVVRLSGVPVPPTLPEGERVIVRAKKAKKSA